MYHVDHPVAASAIEGWSDATAVWFEARGIQPGGRIAVCLQNDVHWATALLAAWKIGAVVVPLNPMIREHELTRYMVDSGSSVLVCSDSFHGEVARAVCAELSVASLLVDPHACCGLSEAPPTFRSPSSSPAAMIARLDDVIRNHLGEIPPDIPLQGSDTALLTYTSGTTGPPKGAMNTHANLVYSAEMTTRWFELGASDRILGIAPLFHITGLVVQFAVCLFSGVPLVLFHRFEAAEALRLAERWKTTFSVGAITAYIAMMADSSITTRDLSSMTKVASGGAPVSAATVARFEDMTGTYIHNAYGLTETTAPSILTPLGVRAPIDPESGALSVGLPVPGAHVTIVDPESRDPLPLGEVGEIAISGPMVVPGYWQQEAESLHAMSHGRLHTGDIGRMNEQGWVFIVDRAKDQINASGYKVWPREVEDVLYDHPAVREAAVVGRPDDYRGETVAAFVSLQSGAAIDASELIEFCRAQLAAYKCPRSVEVLPDLPKTLTGKILRRAIREELSAEQREVRSDDI